MVRVLRLCAARNQIESADASTLNISASKTIANRQNVFGVELIVDARIDSEPTLPRSKDVCERIDDRESLRIKSDRVDE